MKIIAPLLLAWAVSAQPVPMTPELAQSIQNFIVSSAMVCDKNKIPEQKCSELIENTATYIQKKVDEVCKDYPKEKVECTQYWLKELMDMVTRNNIMILKSKSV